MKQKRDRVTNPEKWVLVCTYVRLYGCTYVRTKLEKSMSNTLNSRFEVRISSDDYTELRDLYVQFGYRGASTFIRAIIDTLLHGATTESQLKIHEALRPFIQQSYCPDKQVMADFFDFISQDEYLMLAVRMESADKFYATQINFDHHPEESDFVQSFTAKYKYTILPADMRYLLMLFYNDPVQKAKMMDKYSALVRYKARERQEAIADAR